MSALYPDHPPAVPPEATISDNALLEALDSMSARQDSWEFGDVLNARNATRDYAVAYIRETEVAPLTKTWETTQEELVASQSLIKEQAGLILEQNTENKRLSAALEAEQAEVRGLVEAVNKQAEDEGLWFEAVTAPEAYLQQKLRKLHTLIENAAKE